MDIFALGVLLFRLLGAHDPFYPVSKVESAIEYDDSCWEPVSEMARGFVTQMISIDPKMRGSAASLLESLWFRMPAGELAAHPRAMYAPQPRPDTNFLTLLSAD